MKFELPLSNLEKYQQKNKRHRQNLENFVLRERAVDKNG